jgi:hypothetical protein
MKLILKERNLTESILKEASRKNITETVALALIRGIAKFYAEKALNPEPGLTFFIDVSKEVEALQKKAPQRTVTTKDGKEKQVPSKYDINIKSVLWKVPQIGFNLNDPAHYSIGERQIKLNMEMPYSLQEYEIYLDSLKKKKPDLESFNSSLLKTLLSVMSKHRNFGRKPPEEWTLEQLKALAKEDMKQVPEFTTSNIANKHNLNPKNIKGPFPPITQEKVDNAIKKIAPSPAKMSVIYDMFRKKKVVSGVEEIVSNLMSANYHEITHGRQFSGATDPNVSGHDNKMRISNFTKLFKKENLLLLPHYVYTANTTQVKDDLVDKFHYFTRPYEIDARAEEYRKKLSRLKKEDAATAGQRIFDFVLKRETYWAEEEIPAVRVPYNAPEFAKNQNLIKDEVKYKCLAQVFGQIAYHIKDLSSSDPRYKQKADEYAAKVREINEQIKTIFASTIQYFDPLERMEKVRSAGFTRF